jgi:hypothetical protein
VGLRLPLVGATSIFCHFFPSQGIFVFSLLFSPTQPDLLFVVNRCWLQFHLHLAFLDMSGEVCFVPLTIILFFPCQMVLKQFVCFANSPQVSRNMNEPINCNGLWTKKALPNALIGADQRIGARREE